MVQHGDRELVLAILSLNTRVDRTNQDAIYDFLQLATWPLELDFDSVEAADSQNVRLVQTVVESLRVLDREPLGMQLFHLDLVGLRQRPVLYVAFREVALIYDTLKDGVRVRLQRWLPRARPCIRPYH